MTLTIHTLAGNYRLTTDHAASSYGYPVLVGGDGQAYGPGDLLPDGTPAADLAAEALAMLERFCALKRPEAELPATWEHFRSLFEADPDKQRAVLAALVQQLHPTSLPELLGAAWALREFRGCITPAEQFIEMLLGSYCEQGPELDPAAVREILEQFEQEHQDALFVARRFYGVVAREKAEAGPEPAD